MNVSFKEGIQLSITATSGVNLHLLAIECVHAASKFSLTLFNVAECNPVGNFSVRAVERLRGNCCWFTLLTYSHVQVYSAQARWLLIGHSRQVNNKLQVSAERLVELTGCRWRPSQRLFLISCPECYQKVCVCVCALNVLTQASRPLPVSPANRVKGRGCVQINRSAGQQSASVDIQEGFIWTLRRPDAALPVSKSSYSIILLSG